MKKYLIFALIIGGVLTAVLNFIPMAQAVALTQDQIKAIVSLLQSFGADQSAINNVQTVLGGKPDLTATTAWCHDFNENLGVGKKKGDDVRALLNILVKEGVDTERSSNFSDNFDETIASAVSGFQQKYKDEILVPLGLQYGTGFVGKSTRAKLNKLYGCGGITPSPFTCSQIACVSGQKTICPAGLDGKGCPLPCKCVPKDDDDDDEDDDKTCIQVITPALNPENNVCKNFPTPCDVPGSWKKIDKCPISWENQPPVISGISGPTTLKVKETGVWKVKASDPEQGALSYSVRWGDENATGAYSAAQKNWSYTQTAEFTHSYAAAGNYNPAFTVTDNKDSSAKTSISVNVASITSQNHSPDITGGSSLPPAIQAGENVNFSRNAIDDDNDNLVWSADWGDGSGMVGACSSSNPSNGQGWMLNTSHIWLQAGTYAVKITVSDCKGGTDSSDLTVNVSAISANQ